MKKSEFKKEVLDSLKFINKMGEYKLEPIKEKKTFVEKYGTTNRAVFAYARWAEINFEANLREDYERKTTFTSDFSIAEWRECVERGATLDTMKRCLLSWHTNKVYFAELVIALNMKSWEHHSRGNMEWSRLYSDLYNLAKNLYFMWFEEDQEAIDYLLRLCRLIFLS